MNLRQVLLAAVALLFALHGFKQPMAFIVPMWILAFQFKVPLALLMRQASPALAFVGFGVLFGLMTECFAILGNLDRPDSEKILLHPDPATDLMFGLASYGMTMIVWLVLVRRLRFRLWQVFLATAAYGAVTEQMGQVLIDALVRPWPGIGILMLVGTVYGVFPMLAYMLTDARFGSGRPPARKRHLVWATGLLFAQWALFGLAVLPALKALVGVRA